MRRVIELAAPDLVRALRPRVDEVILASGAAADNNWLHSFSKSLRPMLVTCRTNPTLCYLSEQRSAIASSKARLRAFIHDLVATLDGDTALVWAHNQGLGRNLLLTQEVEAACSLHRIPLALHHHDWWFDNRWARWTEMRRSGFRSLSQVAKTILSVGSGVVHIAINKHDATLLEKFLPGRCAWLPNPALGKPTAPSRKSVEHARAWLHGQLGADAPVWLMPCRLLRRKNIAEALLLTRWLRPEAWLVTTAGITSPDETPYAQRLQDSAQRYGWPLRLNILTSENDSPGLPALIAASEAILLTSLQEGFGLSYLEAAVAGRPLLARMLSNIAPDLAHWGLRFPQSYAEVLVSTTLLDWPQEVARQKRLFNRWRQQLPSGVKGYLGKPIALASRERPESVPFSRLTLTAQLEVLAYPAAESWRICLPLNRWLTGWREATAANRLAVTTCPPSARRSLAGPAFARGFTRLMSDLPESPAPISASAAVQEEFIRRKLTADNLYPLCWAPNT